VVSASVTCIKVLSPQRERGWNRVSSRTGRVQTLSETHNMTRHVQLSAKQSTRMQQSHTQEGIARTTLNGAIHASATVVITREPRGKSFKAEAMGDKNLSHS